MQWLSFLIKSAPVIIAAVQAVEKIFSGLKGKSQDKEDAAVLIVRTVLGAAENILAKDLLNDEKVEQAMREAIRAFVAFENAIAAAKAAKA